MQGRGNSRGWLLDLTAGVALGAAVVLVTWIVSGGQPFGRIIGERDVSEPTTTATKPTAFERRAGSPARQAARLASEPPVLSGSTEPRLAKPKAERARRPERSAAARPRRRERAPRAPAVRVLAPPAEGAGDAPVAVVPAPAAAPAPAPSAPAPSGAGRPAKPRAPAYVVGAGEG